MGLSFLSIDNLRCIERAELALGPGHNLIWGPNGSGKTSLLEGIFLLGRGRSFRTRNTERLIRHGAQELLVFGRTEAPERPIGVQVTRGGRTLAKVGGAVVASLAALSEVVPVQIIDPAIHKLVEEGAPRRRRWLDWAVFHVEPGFIATWSQYHRALRQRNAALRFEAEQASAWDSELVRLGERLSDSRRQCLDRLQPVWREIAEAVVGREVSLTYSQGWPVDRDLYAALLASRARDRMRGLTHVGPHRADIPIRIDGRPARDVASRGQQKLIAVAMVLAQLRMLRAQFETAPALLLDDPAAELDQGHLETFIDQVGRLNCQLVTTSLSPDPRLFGTPEKRFHVEQGRVGPV